MPTYSNLDTNTKCLTAIKGKLIEKRKLHKLWQIDIDSVNLALKTKLNRIIKALRNLLKLERNKKIQKYLNKVSITVAINYSGKPSRDYPQTQYPQGYNSIRKQEESWARRDEKKAKIFAIHFSKVFKHNSRKINLEEENKLLSDAIIAATPDIFKSFKRFKSFSSLKKCEP